MFTVEPLEISDEDRVELIRRSRAHWPAPSVSDREPIVGFTDEMRVRMVEKRTRYSAEFKREAVQFVLDSSRPIAQVAKELGVHEGTLGNWVARYRAEHPVAEEPLSVSERARFRQLEAENRELRMKNEFLGKAAAFFARESQ